MHIVFAFCVYRSFLDHQSQMVIGELIGYPWSGVCRRLSPISNFLSSETAWPITANFFAEPSWEVVTKVYINSPGNMAKIAPHPYNMVKTFENLLLGCPMTLKLGM